VKEKFWVEDLWEEGGVLFEGKPVGLFIRNRCHAPDL
jgi:hypothetical protein